MSQRRFPFVSSLIGLIVGWQGISVALPTMPSAQAASSQVVGLNNEGVKALNAGNFQLAVQKFQEAVKLDPSYGLARENLAIAYNNYGLQLQNNPKEAIKQFHKALYLNRNNATTLSNLEGIISMLGKNPKKFQDRVELGDQARLAADFEGAAIEYIEALRLKEDPKIHAKLGDVYRVRDELDKAIEEFQAAARGGDSADVQVKLGQSYQAKKDLPNAIAAFGRALTLKSDDPDVLDALQAGWNEALRENPQAPENHIGLGQALQYRGDFDQAAAEYKLALMFDRNNATAKRLLESLDQAKKQARITKHVDAGVDLQSRKLYDQAIQEYNVALKEDPNNATIYVNIGSAYQQKEDFDNAIEYYKKALAFKPDNSAAKQGIQASTEARTAKGLADTEKAATDMFKLGRYSDAIVKYQELLKSNPQNAATHFNLGAAYQANKDLESAIAQYRQAISIDPKSEDYKKTLEAALELKAGPIVEQAIQKHKEKDYAAAIDLYQQATAIRPKNAGLWYNLAGAYYSREDYSKAREAYERALDLDPKGQSNNLYSIAIIDEHFDKGAQALSEYQKYLAQAPNGQFAAPARERIKALTANPRDVIKIKSAVELQALKDADDAYHQGIKAQEQKNWEAAITAYQKAMNIQPKDADYPYALGTVFQQKGDYDLAVKWYQTALELKPGNKDITRAIQDAYEAKAAPLVEQAVKKYTAGDPAGAAELYQQALQLIPQNAGLWTNLGAALQNTDDFTGARNAYQKGLDLDAKGQVGNYYFIAALDESSNQGSRALQGYQKYLSLAPTGQYIGAARDRIKALSANPNNVQKIQTQAEAKTLKEAQDAFDQGIKAQQSNNLDEALQLYQKAAQIVPKEAAYVYAIGTVYQGKNDLDAAIESYKKALTLDSKNAEYQKILAAAYDLKAGPLLDEAIKKHGAGDLAGAIDLYLKGLAITPKNARGWTNLAGAYQAMDDFSRARETYQKALDIDSKGEADNFYFIAALDENFNQGAKALQGYQKYVTTAPRGNYAALAQERIKALIANPNNVQKIVTAAEQKKLGDADSAYQAAIKLQQENKFDEAIAQYKQALAVTPNVHSYWYSLGTAYQGQGNVDEAISAYGKALNLNPKEPAYKQLIDQLKQAKAGPLLESAIQKQTTKNEQGNYDLAGAIADYEAALRLYDDATTHLNLGTAYQANNNPQKALAEYNRAVQMDPKQCDAHYYLGTIYEELKQPALAIAAYKKCVTCIPASPNLAAAKDRIKLLGGK